MRRLTRTGVDCRPPLVERCAGVSERHDAAVRHKMTYQMQRAVELGRKRDNTDTLTGPIDFRNDVIAAEFQASPTSDRPETGDRLGASEIRIDEVTFQMRR